MASRWITFDCFGTLVDWNGGFAALLKPIAGARTELLLQSYHKFERMIEAQEPYQPYKEVLTSALSRAAVETGVTLSGTEARILSVGWSSLSVFDDVEPALAALRADDWKLGILTNCDNDLFAQTERKSRYPFDRVITAEQVRAYKPALTHFLRFRELTEKDRSQWVHVACSWYHDICPARELGIKRIWLDRDRTGDDVNAASARITSARELADAVRQLTS